MNRKLTTLGSVFDQIDEMSSACFDKNIDVHSIVFNSLETIRIEGETHPLRPVAQRSISWRLGIPFQYLQRCPQDIQALNMNHWLLEEKNDQLFFRFDGDEVRAIFTPKYVPCDNFEVLERLDSMGFKPNTKVYCHLDKEFMSLSIPDGKKSFDINGDKMRPGISISNSEVGLSSLGIAAFILRLVCTNGLISQTEIGAKNYRHVSGKILSEFPKILDAIDMNLDRQKNQFRVSMESPVENPQGILESFNRQFQLGKTEKDAVEWAWPLEMGDTMFNIVQTYTRAAQFDGLPAASAYQLEKVGGNILAMVN